MSPTDAAKLLELPADATPEQLEARFLELRRRLEDKIAKAPTPGLQTKYRESLTEITTAFETLILAADSSALPVLTKQSANGGGQRTDDGGRTSGNVGSPLAGGPSAARPQGPDLQGSPAPRRKSGGKEFLLVAIIAVAVLGAGAWFVMKTRAENAEKVRIAAEAKAEAERRAEEKRLADEAERQRLAEERRLAEEEKARQAAAAKAEQERLERVATELRVQLAETRLLWETAEREERDTERTLAEHKSELRGLRDPDPGQQAELTARVAAWQDYYDWLRGFLQRHPARVLRARAEELVSARSPDAAVPVVADLRRELADLDGEIRREATARLSITGSVRLDSEPAGLAWTLTDGYGRVRRGTTPALVSEVGLGSAKVTVTREGWSPQEQTLRVARGRTTEHAVKFIPGSLRLESEPAGAKVQNGGRDFGVTPLVLDDLPDGGAYEFRLELPAHMPVMVKGVVKSGRTTTLSAKLETRMVIPDLGLTLLPVRAGSFVMGQGRDVRQVTLTKDFWLGQTEVTQAQWEAVMGSNPSYFRTPDRPVEEVSWDMAMNFCRRLTERERAAGRLPTGFQYTLPTEAQWEYACRAGTTGVYAGDLNAMGWWIGNSGGQSQPVASKSPNAWGFYDMHGNVWEWCADWFAELPRLPQVDPAGPATGTVKTYRGGRWFNPAEYCTSGFRPGYLPFGSNGCFGLRVALSPVN